MKWFIRIGLLALIAIVGLVACAPAQNTDSAIESIGDSNQNSPTGDTVVLNGKPHFLNSYADW